MDNKFEHFKHPKFGEIRVILLDGDPSKPWFVAADVCRALELKNPSDILKRLNDDEKSKIPESRVVVDPILNIGSEKREINIVNEPGLYRLIFSSRKKEAIEFQNWVYHEVLPSIRKHGYYSLTGETAPAVASAPDFASLQAQLDELKAMVAQLLKSNKYLSNIDLEKNIADAVKAGKNPNRVLGQLKRARDYIALMLNEEETFAVVKVGQSSEVESRLNKIAKKYYLRVVNHYKTVLLPRKVALAVEGELKNILDPFKLEGEFFLVDYKVAYVIITALESLAADLSKVYDPEDDNDVLKIEEKLHRKAVKLIAANNLN